MSLATLLLLPTIATAQVAEMVGPLRFADSPRGLVVGDYVGNQVLFLDRTTLQATSWIPIYTDSPSPSPASRSASAG